MIKVTAAIIIQNNKILIGKRKTDDVLGGKWEFPGGKRREGETLQECLKRELKEELNVEAVVGDLFCELKFNYKEKEIHLFAFESKILSGKPKALEHDQLRWVSITQLDKFDFLNADEVIINKLKQRSNKERIVYKPGILKRAVHFFAFCVSFLIGNEIVKTSDGKIPSYYMFLLPIVMFIPLVESFVNKITLSLSSIKVSGLFNNWSINWDQIDSWKYFNGKGTSIGTHFLFIVKDRKYLLTRLGRYGAFMEIDNIRNFIKEHVRKNTK